MLNKKYLLLCNCFSFKDIARSFAFKNLAIKSDVNDPVQMSEECSENRIKIVVE